MTNDVIARAQAREAVIRDFSKVDGFDYLAGDADLLRELVVEIQRLQKELHARMVTMGIAIDSRTAPTDRS